MGEWRSNGQRAMPVSNVDNNLAANLLFIRKICFYQKIFYWEKICCQRKNSKSSGWKPFFKAKRYVSGVRKKVTLSIGLGTYLQ